MLLIVHCKRKRVQCSGPDEARSSMQHDIPAEDNLSLSREKDAEHDNVNQLRIQHNPSSPQNLVIDFVPKVRETRDRTDETFSRLDQRTRTCPPSDRLKRKRTSPLKEGSKVVLKTSTYPNRRNVAYATIRSTNPATKAAGIELGAEFALVHIDEVIMDNEELVREVCDCKTIGDAFAAGYLIAWPSAFIRKKDD